METRWNWIILTVNMTTTTRVTKCSFIDIATMSVMRSTLRQKNASNSLPQVSISNDHTLKSWMKGNFHVQFGIGGGEGDLIADHTKVGIGTWEESPLWRWTFEE